MNFQPPEEDDPRDDAQRWEDAQRAAFESDAEPMGFDLTRFQCAAPEPWSEYANELTGHRWGGWLAALALAQPAPQGWRTIESAPQGTLALFCNMRAAELRHTFFVDWFVGGKFCGNRHNTATHWMPIDAAPTLPLAGDAPLQGEGT